MKKLINRLLAATYILVALLAPAGLSVGTAAAVTSDANIQDNLCAGTNLDVSNTDCSTVTGDAPQQVNDIISTVINIFSVVVGVISVIMIIFGGLKYITSGGNESNVSGAKNTILFAIVGLVIVALAQVIVQFVLSKATDL